jgi:hypothetical protein
MNAAHAEPLATAKSGYPSNVSLAERARRIRRNAVRMGEVQGQGYIAQALGVADVLAVSYFHALRHPPSFAPGTQLSSDGGQHLRPIFGSPNGAIHTSCVGLTCEAAC